MKAIDHDLDKCTSTIKTISQKITKPLFSPHHPLNSLAIKIFTFSVDIQKILKLDSQTDTIETIYRDRIFLIFTFVLSHTPSFRWSRRRPNYVKAAPHSLISSIFSLFLSPTSNPNSHKIPSQVKTWFSIFTPSKS